MFQKNNAFYFLDYYNKKNNINLPYISLRRYCFLGFRSQQQSMDVRMFVKVHRLIINGRIWSIYAASPLEVKTNVRRRKCNQS